MTNPQEVFSFAVASKLMELLRDDEGGWYDAASWIDQRAIEEGLDLYADFRDVETFSHSLVEAMRVHADFDQRFPNGQVDLERFETAEELFWHLMPRREPDSSANQK
jgi:hypothetical protein